jgi:MFS family permease
MKSALMRSDPPTASEQASAVDWATEPGNAIWALGLQRKWWVMAVAVPSVALAEVAFTVLIFSNIMVLQAIDSDIYGYQWATGPYLVCLVVNALLSVRFAQTFGSRHTYVAGAILTGMGCLVAAGAESLLTIVIARLLMSGKVLVLAVTLSQMWLVFPRRKGPAMGVYNAAMYGGLFLGAALGGFLEFQISWRTIYFVSGLVFLVLALAGYQVLIHDRPANPPPLKLNGLEVTLLGSALSAALFLMLRGAYYGWLDSNLVAFVILAAVLGLAGFVWTALKASDPLVNLRLGAFPTLAATLPVIGIFGGAVVGVLNTLPSYLNLRGYPSAVAGWIMFVPAVVMVASCLATGFVFGRVRTVVTLWAGLALNLIGGLWLLDADLYTSKRTIVAMLCIWAVGVGLVLPTALRLTFSGQTPAAVQRLAGVKVALRFAATVLGAFTASLIIQRGADTGQDLLRQKVTEDNTAYRQVITRVRQHVITHGSHPAIAAEQAGTVVGNWVAYNAQMIGHRAGRRYLSMLTAVALFIAFFIRFRSETSILADDLLDFGWLGGHEGPPKSEAPPGKPA